jgi:dolichyl-phosphate beta-glucosyltransferase
VARPESFLIPTKLTLISGPASVFDSSVYIGLPLLVLAIAVTVRMRRHPAVLAAAVTLACAMVLALGGRLTIHGAATRIPLPWLIPAHLPVIGSLLPVRLMVAGYLALAVIVAVFLDRVLETSGRRRIGGLAVVVVALIPLIPTLPIQSSRLDIPAFFTDGSAQRLPTTGSVLMTPYGNQLVDYPPELWEAMSDLAFKTQLGIVYTPGPDGHLIGPDPEALGQELNALGDLDKRAPATLSASVRAAYLADMRAHDVTTVIVGPSPGAAQVERLMTELLGRPGVSTGGVVVWYEVPALEG